VGYTQFVPYGSFPNSNIDTIGDSIDLVSINIIDLESFNHISHPTIQKKG
jgi:hypothetical protein